MNPSVTCVSHKTCKRFIVLLFCCGFSTLGPRRNRRHFAEAIFKCIFFTYLDDDGEATYETLTFLCLNLKITFICVYWWTRQRIDNTLIVVNRYLQLMGDKTIPDSLELCLESFYPPFVAGIDPSHQGVADSYNFYYGCQRKPFITTGSNDAFTKMIWIIW